MFSFTTGFSKDELIRISQELDSIRTPCCLGPAGYTATVRMYVVIGLTISEGRTNNYRDL